MAGFIRRRLLALIPLVLVTTSMVFSLVLLLPGDPAVALAGLDNADEQKLALIRERMGLNQPVPVQYLHWLGKVATGDLGTSLRTGGPVAETIGARLPVTIQVACLATLLSLTVSIPLGVLGAYRPGGPVDRLISGLSALGVAVPNFWLGSMLVLLFALRFRWLPATGQVSLLADPLGALSHLLLPVLTLSLASTAEITRQLRSALDGVLATDFIRTARAKGLASRVVLWRHALRNALVPVVTLLGLTVSRLLGGTAVIESVFALPGLGRLNLESILNRDFVMLQGSVLVLVVMVIVVNLLTDLAYGLVDPRIRYS